MARTKIISDEAVLAAAASVMFAKGPSEFTLADAAKAAGIAPATLVQRFGDKHGLIVAAIAQDNAGFERFLAALPDQTGAEAVIDIFARMFPDVGVDVGHFADQLLWLRQDMRDPDLNRLARERFAMLRSAVAKRLPPLSIPADAAASLVEEALNKVVVLVDRVLQEPGLAGAPEARKIDCQPATTLQKPTLVGGRLYPRVAAPLLAPPASPPGPAAVLRPRRSPSV